MKTAEELQEQRKKREEFFKAWERMGGAADDASRAMEEFGKVIEASDAFHMTRGILMTWLVLAGGLSGIIALILWMSGIL